MRLNKKYDGVVECFELVKVLNILFLRSVTAEDPLFHPFVAIYSGAGCK